MNIREGFLKRMLGSWTGLPLIIFLVLPIAALILSSSPSQMAAALKHPMLLSAAWLSFRTSLLSTLLIIALGTPLAWWFAGSNGVWMRVLRTVVELPIVIPPAVMGIALLQTYGRRGLLGDLSMGSIPFSIWAVVIAQMITAAPFYVQAAAAGFRDVDRDTLLVARTLGASPWRAFARIAVPAAFPALAAGAALAWARALGEFGATLLFAGNMPGSTQTMPLAIYSALESDIELARALALLLGGTAFMILIGLRILAPMAYPTREDRP